MFGIIGAGSPYAHDGYGIEYAPPRISGTGSQEEPPHPLPRCTRAHPWAVGGGGVWPIGGRHSISTMAGISTVAATRNNRRETTRWFIDCCVESLFSSSSSSAKGGRGRHNQCSVWGDNSGVGRGVGRRGGGARLRGCVAHPYRRTATARSGPGVRPQRDGAPERRPPEGARPVEMV